MSHGVMFHHFHDDRDHPHGQGSISVDQFREVLRHLTDRHRVLCAQDYYERSLRGALQSRDICLSFDDALRCQYDVALPVLDEFGLKAFFFVYSSVFTDQPDRLELYRDFRNTRFTDIETFYREFFDCFSASLPAKHADYLRRYPSDYLRDFSFYTDNDRRFRFVRDQVLGKAAYEHLMHDMMLRFDYSPEQRKKALWMSAEQVAALAGAGHEVGLHSHNHPTQMHRLDRDVQYREYRSNYRALSDICGSAPRSMSHPCGHYNRDTLEILEELDIELGFRSNLSPEHGHSALEIPREDHTNLMRGLL